AWDRTRRRRHLFDMRAGATRKLRPYMSVHLEVARHVVKRFADVLAQRAQLATTVRAPARCGGMNDGFARQVCGEGARPTTQDGDVISRLRRRGINGRLRYRQ